MKNNGILVLAVTGALFGAAGMASALPGSSETEIQIYDGIPSVQPPAAGDDVVRFATCVASAALGGPTPCCYYPRDHTWICVY